jgi:hypothetical protein
MADGGERLNTEFTEAGAQRAQRRGMRILESPVTSHKSPATEFLLLMEIIRFMDAAREVDILVECALECFSRRQAAG